MQSFLVRFAVLVLAGAVVGLLAGLLLAALDVVANPFWGVAAGVLAASVWLVWDQARGDLTERE